jgi:hypothetical protein
MSCCLHFPCCAPHVVCCRVKRVRCCASYGVALRCVMLRCVALCCDVLCCVVLCCLLTAADRQPLPYRSQARALRPRRRPSRRCLSAEPTAVVHRATLKPLISAQPNQTHPPLCRAALRCGKPGVPIAEVNHREVRRTCAHVAADRTCGQALNACACVRADTNLALITLSHVVALYDLEAADVAASYLFRVRLRGAECTRTQGWAGRGSEVT